MSFKTAQESFESAQESAHDPAIEAIAAGLVDLTKAIKAELARLKSATESIKTKS